MDDDPELAAIRAQRLAQLKAQQGKGGGGGGGGRDDEQAEARQREAEERRHLLLARILTPAARERVSRIALVKPERARETEDIIIQAAQTGQIQGQVDEDQLKQLLEKLSENEQGKKTKVTIQRRRGLDDD